MEENTPPVPEKDHIPAQGDTTPAQENIPPTQENILQTSENVPPVPGNDIPKPQNKKRSIRIATIFIILSVVVAVILMCLPLLIEKAAKDALIKIPRHATREMVQDSISKYLDDDYAEKVMRVAKLRGSDFGERHGAYLIEQGMSPLQRAQALTWSTATTHRHNQPFPHQGESCKESGGKTRLHIRPTPEDSQR